jgi:4-hydroxybenzoate polyprenyltransferase
VSADGTPQGRRERIGFVLGNLVVVLAVLGLSEAAVWWLGGGRGWGSLTLVGGVMAAYSLDRVLDAPQTERKRVTLRFLPPLLVGSGMVAVGLWKVPSHLWLVALLALFGGAYVPLKKFVPKGVLTAGAWAMGVVWLPGARTPTFAEGWSVALCTLLIVGANAVLCDTLDVDADRRNGVRGLGPWLGEAKASAVATAMAVAGGVTAFTTGAWPLAAAALPLAIAGVVRGWPKARETRRTALDLVLVLPGVVCLCL